MKILIPGQTQDQLASALGKFPFDHERLRAINVAFVELATVTREFETYHRLFLTIVTLILKHRPDREAPIDKLSELILVPAYLTLWINDSEQRRVALQEYSRLGE